MVDQFICASLSHTHYWSEVGMLEVSAIGLWDCHNMSNQRPRNRSLGTFLKTFSTARNRFWYYCVDLNQVYHQSPIK